MTILTTSGAQFPISPSCTAPMGPKGPAQKSRAQMGEALAEQIGVPRTRRSKSLAGVMAKSVQFLLNAQQPADQSAQHQGQRHNDHSFEDLKEVARESRPGQPQANNHGKHPHQSAQCHLSGRGKLPGHRQPQQSAGQNPQRIQDGSGQHRDTQTRGAGSFKGFKMRRWSFSAASTF